MLLGELIKHRRAEKLFVNPKHPKTAEYVQGRHG